MPACHHKRAHPPQAGRVEIRLAALCGIDADGGERIGFEAVTQSGGVSRLPMADGLMHLPAEAESLPNAALVQLWPVHGVRCHLWYGGGPGWLARSRCRQMYRWLIHRLITRLALVSLA